MASKRNSTGEQGSPGAMDASAGEPDDATLLSRAKWGNEEAFGELVSRHGRYLYGIAHAMLSDRSDAEDAVQETFAAVLKSSFRGESAVRTWLVSILVRQAAVIRRKRRRTLQTGPIFPVETTAASAEGAVDARIDIAAMLARLSPEHRDVIILRELQGMSYDEIALALEVPRGTVESRLHRAREQLKLLFGVGR